MLILSRKIGEKIVIGNGIEVVVQRISGVRVTLGISAPPEVKILRGELTAEIPQPSIPIRSRNRLPGQEPVAVRVRHHVQPRFTATGTFSAPQQQH